MCSCFPTSQLLNLLRVDAETERVGLDVAEHGGNAYELQRRATGLRDSVLSEEGVVIVNEVVVIPNNGKSVTVPVEKGQV